MRTDPFLNLYEFVDNDGINAEDFLGLVLQVAGKDVKTSDPDYAQRQGDDLTKEILGRMMGSTEEFSFSCWADFDKNRDLRNDIINLMNYANTSGNLQYTSTDANGQYLPGKAPSVPTPDWTVSPPNQYSFVSSGATSSYHAINSFFGGPTYLECLTCTESIVLKAEADVLGQEAFDKSFPSPLLINITPSSTPLSSGLFSPATDSKTIIPGDWVYFKNNANYPVVHPYGYWQGENAIYIGKGIYSGFGAGDKTLGTMRLELLHAYNDSLSDSQKIGLKDVPEFPENIQRPIVK